MSIFRKAGVRFGILAASSLGLVALSQPGALTAEYQHSQAEQEFSGRATLGNIEHKSSFSSSAGASNVPFQISQGEGGAFIYQIWQNLHGSEYYLFIWEREHSSNEAPTASYNFDSATGAMNFFTCRYARERLASCNMLVSSVSYNVPETCVFPWIDCE